MTATDRVVVLTGATSGIGRVAARDLARRGATVAAVGRNQERGRALEAATAEDPGTVTFHAADLASLAAVRDLAADLRETYEEIHVLANNAGIASAERRESPDGLEHTLAINHLAPYLLTHELLDRLRATGAGADEPARVVATASELHRRGTIAREDLQFERGYDGLDAYARSKLANVAFTLELAERLGSPPAADVLANAFSPGFVRGTRIWQGASLRARVLTRLAALVPGVGTDVETGGERLAAQIASPDYADRSGLYVNRGSVTEPAADAADPAVRSWLWERSASLVGVDPEWP